MSEALEERSEDGKATAEPRNEELWNVGSGLKQRHEKEKKYKCPHCEKRFRFPAQLEPHLRTHTGDRPFMCQVCGQGFTVMSSMRRHLRVHTGEKPYMCPKCGKSFTKLDNLKNHVKNKDEREEKPRHQCDLCDKSYARAHVLRRHMTTHTQDMQYKCEICDKQFAWKESFKRHLVSHTGERPFVCKVCGAAYPDHTALKKHVLSSHPSGTVADQHERTVAAQCERKRPAKPGKVHVCHMCGKGYNQSYDLKRHMYYHTGERPFTCQFCNKGFTHTAALTGHVRIHTGEKPFVCMLCGQTFARKGNLNSHMKFMHASEVSIPVDAFEMSLVSEEELKAEDITHSDEPSIGSAVSDAQ